MKKNTHCIRSIYVEELFGYYTYEIPQDNFISNNSPLLILYSDNGSGKTTILELIFHLLASARESGHKTTVARIKFKEIKVILENKVEVIARRKKAEEGNYELIINQNNEEYLKFAVECDSELSFKPLTLSQDKKLVFDKIMGFLVNLNISIFLLTDRRKMLNGTENLPSKNQNKNSNEAKLAFRENEKNEENDIETIAVKSLESWIRQQVLQAARKGERDNNTIYTDIVKRITHSRKSTVDPKKKISILKTQLEEVRKKSTSFYKYGLISKVETQEIENILQKSKPEKLHLIYNVIEPFYEGLKARLDSLQEIHDLIYAFISSINSYFNNKTIEYSLSNGFAIKYSKTNDFLKLSMLSSGERQLILLICNIITASSEATIFIIDEPEISLNVQWQRKLGDTLLEFAKGKNVQFILATHSIELLTNHRENVCKLINLK